MNVGSYYAAGASGGVFPPDRLYGSSTVHDIDHGGSRVKFDLSSCPSAGYASTAPGFDATVHGYQGQLHQQPAGIGFSSYSPFESQSTAVNGAKSTLAAAGSYPGFNYVPCGQPSAVYPGTPPSLGAAQSRYLQDSAKFDSIAACGNDVISQYGGRHFGTAAMMAAAAVATMGGQHHAVGPTALPIYPWMRSMGAGMHMPSTS